MAAAAAAAAAAGLEGKQEAETVAVQAHFVAVVAVAMELRIGKQLLVVYNGLAACYV